MFKLSTASFSLVLSSTLTAFACFAGAPPCSAQATMVRVHVPFAFEADKKHFEPGVYTISMEHTSPFMEIVGETQSGRLMFVPDETLLPVPSGKVVFQRYGSEYFLREVWVAASRSHVHTLPSKAEKRLELAAAAAGFEKKRGGVEVAATELPR